MSRQQTTNQRNLFDGFLILPRVSRNEALFQHPEAGKLFFEKWEQLSTQVLYVSVGVFAVLPAAISTLRRPYYFHWLIWAIVIVGIPTIAATALLKLHLNGYYRRLALVMAQADLAENEMHIHPASWILLMTAGLGVLLQVGSFVTFVSVNIPHTAQEPPRIEGIQPNQAVVEPGAMVTIQAGTLDRDGDKLFFTWRADDGTIIDTDEPTVSWVAPKKIPSEGKTVSISLAVSDGQANTEKQTSIIVRESPEIDAGIKRLCLMAAPLEGPQETNSNPKIKNNSAQTLSSSASIIEAKFQTKDSLSPSVAPGFTCARIREVVEAGETTAEKKVRLELLEPEVKALIVKRTKASSKDKLQGWFKCCSSSLSLICNPMC